LARTAHVPLAQTRAACLWQIAGHLDIPVKRLQRYLELTQESVSFEVRSESAFAIPQVPAYNTTACAQLLFFGRLPGRSLFLFPPRFSPSLSCFSSTFDEGIGEHVRFLRRLSRLRRCIVSPFPPFHTLAFLLLLLVFAENLR